MGMHPHRRPDHSAKELAPWLTTSVTPPTAFLKMTSVIRSWSRHHDALQERFYELARRHPVGPDGEWHPSVVAAAQELNAALNAMNGFPLFADAFRERAAAARRQLQ